MTLSCRCERLRTNNPRPLLAVCAVGAPASVGPTTASSAVRSAALLAVQTLLNIVLKFNEGHLPRELISRYGCGFCRIRGRGRVCWLRGAFFACLHSTLLRSSSERVCLRHVVLVQILNVQRDSVTWASLVKTLTMRFVSRSRRVFFLSRSLMSSATSSSGHTVDGAFHLQIAVCCSFPDRQCSTWHFRLGRPGQYVDDAFRLQNAVCAKDVPTPVFLRTRKSSRLENC